MAPPSITQHALTMSISAADSFSDLPKTRPTWVGLQGGDVSRFLLIDMPPDVDGARTLLHHQQLRDRRCEAVKKLKADLGRVKKEIEENFSNVALENARKTPLLAIEAGKVVVMEDDLGRRE